MPTLCSKGPPSVCGAVATMERRRLYFGHPVNVYNTDLEKFLLSVIETHFSDWEIENPNSEEHELGYKAYREETGNGMNYFFERVLPNCHGGVFLSFRDGKWGRGVFNEMKWFFDRNLSAWCINHMGEIHTIEKRDFDNIKVLSVEETRARVRDVNGKLLSY